jgi:hypothetical protein
MELLRVGKRLEQQGVLFVDLWPEVLSFCGRGWFDPDSLPPRAIAFGTKSTASAPFDEEDSESSKIIAIRK